MQVFSSCTMLIIISLAPGNHGHKSNVSDDDILSRLAVLERKVEVLQRENDVLRSKNCDTCKINTLKEQLSSQADKIQQQDEAIDALRAKVSSLSRLSARNSSHSKRFLDNANIGFSTYLNHDLNGVHQNQKIVFNVALYNDGGGYSTSTGIFTCPYDGVYLFIYFIGNRHSGELDARLMVNGLEQNWAVAEGVQTAHDVQGGMISYKGTVDEIMTSH